MELILPARRAFLKLARQTLARFGADPAALDATHLQTGHRAGIEFTLEEIEFALVHSADPDIDGLVLVKCALGPLLTIGANEICARLLAANYALSSSHSTGLALDADGKVIYTRQCAMETWSDQGVAALMVGMAALAAQWREGQLPDVDGLRPLLDDMRSTASLAFA